MRIRRMDFKERYHMDKSVRKALIVASILVFCTAIIGIMVANGTITLARSNAMISARVTGTGHNAFVKGLTDYDRIYYWEGDGVSRGTIKQDMEEGIKYWQAIPAEYSAGRIISDNPNTKSTSNKPIGKEAYCPITNFQYTNASNGKISTVSWMKNNFDKYKAFCGYTGGLSGFKSTKIGQWSGESELVVNQTKDLRAWIDYYDGAAYEDKFYDMRVYGWSSRSAVLMAYEGSGPSMTAHDFIVPIFASSVYEFHFYPSGTLKQLQWPDGKHSIIYKGPKPAARVNAKASKKDEWQQGYNLYYDYEAYFNNARDKDGNKANYLKDCSGDNCDVCLGLPKMYWKDKTGKEYPREDGRASNKSRKCYTDTAAYRDENGKILYTGVYGHFEDGYTPGPDAESWGAMSYKNAEHFIIDYTAKEYEEYLKEKEKSINPLTPDEEDPAASETQGVFKGTVKIHQWLTAGPFISIIGGGTVEKNADGTTSRKNDVNVYTKHNQTFYISNPWEKTYLNQTVKNYMEKKYCPSDDNTICNYRWSTVAGNVDYDPYHNGSGSRADMWITFTSSYENPFTYIWDWGNCAHADVGEDTVTVAYVFDGDVESLPDDYPEIYKQMKEFNEEYERVYKQPLSEDPFFTKGEGKDRGIDPRTVYKLFKVAKYSDYDPYAVNASLPEDSGIDKEEFGWYNCEAMEDDCLIPNDNPDHNSGDQEKNGVNYLNGYDFIKEDDRVYYGCLSCSLATYFPNTCYSNKNEPDKIKNFTDQTDGQPGIGEEKERQQ